MMDKCVLQLVEEKEKWEEEIQEKDKDLLDVRQHLEEQRRERQEEVEALLEKQLVAVEEATERLKTSHRQEMEDMKEKQQQEVGFINLLTTTPLRPVGTFYVYYIFM